MRVAVVVPTPAAERPLTRRCLEAVASTTRDLDVVVHPVESSGPDFRFARSVNRGIHATEDADFWVLLNDDCFVDPGWLPALLETVERHPRVGVVGAVLRYPQGGLQHAGGWVALRAREYLVEATRQRAPFWALRQILRRRRLFFPWMSGHHRRLRPTNRLDFVTGACLGITAACREAVGDFDERYRMQMEDVDYCLRARQEGLEVGLATEATAVHQEAATSDQLRPAIVESVRRFQEKWSPEAIWSLTRRRQGVLHPLNCGGHGSGPQKGG